VANAVEQYKAEHRLITQVVNAFERYIGAIESDDDVPRQDLARFISFFREFGDLGHHEKEEGILIAAMVRSGCVWDDGPVEKVRKEHHHERYLMRSLRHAALQKDPWSSDARLRVVSTSRLYVQFMRDHVRLEEGELFPLADECLSGEAGEEVARRFERFDEEWDEAGELTWLRELADELVVRYPQPD
jgi:hemerythrin-like domain-containing protein